jgi:hypothetical protein
MIHSTLAGLDQMVSSFLRDLRFIISLPKLIANPQILEVF